MPLHQTDHAAFHYKPSFYRNYILYFMPVRCYDLNGRMVSMVLILLLAELILYCMIMLSKFHLLFYDLARIVATHFGGG